MKDKIFIAGGGLAGLACGLELRRQGLPVELHEKGRYPLKKVCGEFLSPLGWQQVQALGAAPYLPTQPIALRKARFYFNKKDFFEFNIDPPCQGITRANLDTALAKAFQAAGGLLRELSSVRLETRPAEEIWVDATGRRGDGAAKQWLGWKGYVEGRENLPEGLETTGLNFLPVQGGYCGISPVEGKKWNVCLLTRSPARLAEVLVSHPILQSLQGKLQHFASVAGFSLSQHPSQGLFISGDRWCTWPPIAGDGMSAALAGGRELALYLAGQPSPQAARWETLCRQKAGRFFQRSLWLHALALQPTSRWLTGIFFKQFPSLPATLYRATRSQF